MKYCATDTETTGLEPGSRLVSFASQILDDEGGVAHTFSSLVNPGMPIPADVTKIHGITDADVADAPDAKGVLIDWLLWVLEHTSGEVTIVAHNTPYDVGILSWEMGRAGIVMPTFATLDTCKMAKAHGKTPNNKLQTLVEHHGIKLFGDAHNALTDADACRQLFNILRKEVAEEPTPWASEYAYTDTLHGDFGALPDLVTRGYSFEFHYTDAKGAETTRKITPYGYASRADGVYFHGLCHEKSERRTFRTDRAVPIPF